MAFVPYQGQQRCLEGNGVGDRMDAGLLSVIGAMIAAIAGAGLAIAATTLVRRAGFLDSLEFDGGYNAMAAVVDR